MKVYHMPLKVDEYVPQTRETNFRPPHVTESRSKLESHPAPNKKRPRGELNPLPPAPVVDVHPSGDTTPCRMTGVTLHRHVRYTEI